jgi:hypothetical protein
MAFERGELSFSKVRALTRLAEPVDDDAMVDLARTATASQLDRLIAGCQQALTTGPESDELTTGWMTRSYRSQGRADGMVAITLLVTPDDAERIERAVEQRTDHLVAEATAGTAGTGTAGTGDTADNAPGSVQEWVKERGGWSSVRADAAVELLTGLGDREDPDPAELAIEVDITALASGDGSGGHSSTAGHWLSHEVIRRYGCDGIARVIATDGDHQPLGVGRRQRIVPRWLRRRLERRDHHHCQFPGCDTTRRLHVHHIVHWADGGPTTLENLLLLCSFHHHVIHDRDWAISGTAPDHQITTPDGMPTTVPCLTGDPTTVANLDIGDPASLTASWAGERLDLAFAVEALIDHLKGTP